MAGIRERLTEFAISQGFRSLSGFEKACGFTKNTLTKDRSGISSATLVRIVDFYPQLSLDWVILGRGGMTISPDSGNDGEKESPLNPENVVTVNIGNWGELVDNLKAILGKNE